MELIRKTRWKTSEVSLIELHRDPGPTRIYAKFQKTWNLEVALRPTIHPNNYENTPPAQMAWGVKFIASVVSHSIYGTGKIIKHTRVPNNIGDR